MKLTFIIGARGKPVQLCETLEVSLKNIVEPSTRVILTLDADDEFTVGYVERRIGNAVEYSIEDRPDGFGDKWNRGVGLAPADLYACGFDDEAIITPGWDRRLLDAYSLLPSDGIGAVYNHIINASFPSCPGYSHSFVKQLGYIYPPYFPFWFIDHWQHEILKLIGRISFADVATDGSYRGKTRGLRDLEFWGKFFDDTRGLRISLAKRIIESPEFHATAREKKLLLNNFYWIMEEILPMNQYVRQHWGHLEKVQSEDAPREERTERAISRAKDLLSMWDWQKKQKAA